MLSHRGAQGPGRFGPGAQTFVWKHVAAEAAEAANAYEISESPGPESTQ